ncbi:GGDEF domain-containing protein [Litorilituus lipolyticus]|uniref:diguanylate cyclase n=1 Tax=Litorilituus lipolyticus TaxID=2491017 RepID=A0A502KMH9_9GAMM|nr:GGDEF domain-containing protein [Litorilituus lipolyticus]TPH12890.1 sensor domain-containing diguanylate cyclase [Litorilituus lipolyticus]
MKINLSQQIIVFSVICAVIFTILLISILWSSITIDLAFKRENYAQKVDNHTNTLKQLMISDDIYAMNYNDDSWLYWQNKLSTLLKFPPKLTAPQKTIQQSLKSQNENVRHLFDQIALSRSKAVNSSVQNHFKVRLMTQLESIRSDSVQLSSIVKKDIHQVIKQQVIVIIFTFVLCFLIVIVGGIKLSKIFTLSLKEVKQAFEANHSGNFQEITLSHHTDEFESIAKAFNAMNSKLSENTVSLEAMKKIVEEKTKVLQQLSDTDPLTKVANRRALFERGNMEYSRGIRGSNQLTILLLDCDLFKSINDKYGHLFGDEVLKHVCNICDEAIRDIDFLARYGGEEFIVILPECDIDGGVDIANRIQQLLAQQPIKNNSKLVKLTLSIGVSSLSANHESFEDLIGDADKAMYIAKERGRNRVEVLSQSALH